MWARESRDYEPMGRWSIVGRRILQVFWVAAGGLYGFVGCGAFPIGGLAAFYWFLGWGVGGLDDVPFRWRDAAWEDRIVGTGALIGGMVNAAGRLRERIVGKAGGRYDITDVPFVIAVGVHDTMCSDDQVMEALYGGEAVVVATGRLVRRNDGVFGTDRERPEGRHRRVSGIAVVNNLRWWELEAADLAIYDNPYATRPSPDGFVPWTRRYGAAEETSDGVRFGWRAAAQPGPTV